MHSRIEQAFSLTDRVAVITGAGSGIGREAAVLFSQAGAHVVIADINREALDQTADLIGENVTIIPTNVGIKAEIDNLAAGALTISDRIDVWANVAGIVRQFDVLDATESELEEVISINLKSAYWGCAAAGKAMSALSRGSIINISSNGGDSSPEGLSAYAITKAGVNALTRSVARELGPLGIRANTVSPGSVETPMVSFRYTTAEGTVDESLREETLHLRKAASPLGLMGQPGDIAYAMLYLASDASRFVTGQILRPNGGVTML